MAVNILIINCATMIAMTYIFGAAGGISTTFEGDCQVSSQLFLGLHLISNACSSLLLNASNYTMQVPNVPKRSEYDAAHIRGDWLDVGITSLWNISRITWPRRLLSAFLGVTSVAIHLHYHSAAFKTIDGNRYDCVVATPKFPESDALPPPACNESQYMYDFRSVE